MLFGTHFRQVHDKCRVIIPKEFREYFDGRAVLMHGFEECLVVYRMDEFEKLCERLAKPLFEVEDRDLNRLILGSAQEIRFDNQGRMLIPHKLRGHFLPGGKVVILGQGNYIEIWDETKWEEYKKEKISNAAERLPQLNRAK